jgi:hypothetical protein
MPLAASNVGARMTGKWLVLNPEKLFLAVGPGGDVFVQLQYPHEDTGLLPVLNWRFK